MNTETGNGQTLADVMTGDPDTVEPDTTIQDAAIQMRDSDIGSLLVVQDGQLEGILTDRDIVIKAIAMGLDPTTETIGSLTSTNVTTATPEMTVHDAANLMADRQVRRLPILDGSRLVGIVSMQDVAQATLPAVAGMAEQGITAE